VSFRDRDNQDLGQLPGDVAELLARGRDHLDPLDLDVRARLRGRLLAAAPAGGGASGGGEPRTGAAPAHPGAVGSAFLTKPIALLLTTFALGMGSGAVLDAWLRSGAPVAPPAQAPPPTVLSVASGPAPEPAAPPSPSAACPAPPARAPERDRETDRGLGRERALLDQARAALVGGDAHRALVALDRHRRLFSGGRLEEERDVLRVRALLAAGRAKEGRAEAGRFLRKHPVSLFRPAVEQVIDAKTDSGFAPNQELGGPE
jgi:hypothetical protein